MMKRNGWEVERRLDVGFGWLLGLSNEESYTPAHDGLRRHLKFLSSCVYGRREAIYFAIYWRTICSLLEIGKQQTH